MPEAALRLYVDHIIDSLGALFMVAGLAISGYMDWWVAAGLLLSFYLLSINAYLATYTLGASSFPTGS